MHKLLMYLPVSLCYVICSNLALLLVDNNILVSYFVGNPGGTGAAYSNDPQRNRPLGQLGQLASNGSRPSMKRGR